MGSLPNPIQGPVIRFIIDQPNLSAAVAPALQQVQQQTKQATAQIADSWKQTAAQIRASLSTGVSTQREMTAEQNKLVAALDKQIRQLAQRNDLSNKELASLKAMTLERERQADAIKRGVKVGVTSGTSSALGQVSAQTLLGVERILDSLINRYLGGAAGAAARTIRDVSYYSNQANGGSGGVLGGLTSGFSSLAESIGPANIALGATVAAMAALGIAAGSVTVSLAKTNEGFENMASMTGLSSRQVQVFAQLAKESELDVNGIVSSIARFQSELGEYIRKGQGAQTETIRFVAGLKSLGITVTDAGGKLRDPVSILNDLSGTLRAIPDPAERSARALDILGSRGRELLPLLLSNKGALADLVKEIDKSGPIIGDSQAAQLDRAKSAWDQLTRSISASNLSLKEFVASHFLSATKLDQIVPRLPSPEQAMYDAVKRAGLNPLKPGETFFTGSKADAEADLKIQQELEAGGKRQLELEDLRKKYNEALKDNQTEQAAQLLKQVNSLKDALDLEKKRLDTYKQIASEASRLHPGETEQQKFNNELYKTIGPSLGISLPNRFPTPTAPNIPSPTFPDLVPFPLGQANAPQSVLDQLKTVNDEYLKQNQSETDKIKAEFNAQLDYWKFIQNQYPDVAKQASDAIVKLKEEEAQKLQAIADKAFEKYKKDADKVFDDLLSGKTKSFTKTLEKDIEDIVTQPARKLFDDFVGKMLQGLDQAVNGKTGTGSGSSSNSSATSAAGGVLGPILSKIGIGGTAGTFPGSTGLGKSGAGQVAIQTGQTGVMTQTMNVQANVVNIGSGTGPAGTSPASFSGSSFFGNNNPFGGGSSFFGNNNPLGGSTSAGTGPLNGQLGPLAGGLLVGGLGVMNGSVTSEAMGAAAVASSLARVFGANNASAIGPTSGTQSLGSQLSGVFGGAGMLASGLSQPGFSGELSDIGGGAAIGTAIMPGIGTAIGAAAGAVAGLIKGIFSGPSWGQRVHNAMKDQQVIMPPSETFNFASNGSIANTLQTGFSQSGNTFSQYQLPANTPFWANPIHGPLSHLEQQQLASEEAGLIPGQPFLGFPTVNPFTGQGPVGDRRGSSVPNVQVNLNLPGVIDAGSISSSIAPHLNKLAALVSTQMYASSNGLARNVRSLVALV